MGFFKRIFRDRFSDRADSLVTAFIVFPLVISLIITGVDFGMYMNNKSAIQSAARDAARTVSILGGNSDNTAIAKTYGINNTCVGMGLSAIECETINKLSVSSLTQVVLMGKDFEDGEGIDQPVKCFPEETSGVGQSVYCEIYWMYDGLPLSMLGLTSNFSTEEDAPGQFSGDYSGLGFPNRTVGYAAAETNMGGD